jgi:hypothetical protein
MFRNLFGSRRLSESSSRPRFRPNLEVLEDRTVPTVVSPLVTLGAVQTTLTTNPTLANANALLNNQLAGELAFLSTSNPAPLNQTLASQLVNNFLFSSGAPIPNAVGNSLLLVEQETLLSTDIVLLTLDPNLANFTPFAASISVLAVSIQTNPQFLNGFGATTAFSAGALALNLQLSPFLTATTITPLNTSTASFGFGTTVVSPTLGQTTFPAIGSPATLASFGFGSTPSAISPVPFGFNVTQVGFSTQQFGFGSVLTVP